MNFVSTNITIAIPMIAITRQIGNDVNGAVTMCCNGILIDPNIIPISVATVSCLWFSNIYLIILLIAMNPIPAPNRKTTISIIEILCSTLIMYSYCPKSNRSDDPDIPGNSIAHIAMNPDMKRIGNECAACIGFNPTKMYANIANTTVTDIALMLNASNCL